jgi:hypothetical protein
MAEATIGALANLATATAADRGVVATLTEANARLVKQLEGNSNELRELKALIEKEIFENRGQHGCNPVNTSGKAGAQIPHLPLGDDSPPGGRYSSTYLTLHGLHGCV